jgi:hypothetical protein
VRSQIFNLFDSLAEDLPDLTNFDCRLRKVTAKGAKQSNTSFRALANACANESITARQMQKWYTAGSRLIYLASASE